VLVPTGEFIQKLCAARLAADVMGVPTIIVARTDALGAYLLTSDIDDRDKPFCQGEGRGTQAMQRGRPEPRTKGGVVGTRPRLRLVCRAAAAARGLRHRDGMPVTTAYTQQLAAGRPCQPSSSCQLTALVACCRRHLTSSPHRAQVSALLLPASPRPTPPGQRTPEGFYRISGGIESAIARGLAYAPYADLLWFETSEPSMQEAELFAKAIHEKFPGGWVGQAAAGRAGFTHTERGERARALLGDAASGPG
jgi:isocitrate lyase